MSVREVDKVLARKYPKQQAKGVGIAEDDEAEILDRINRKAYFISVHINHTFKRG